MPSSWAHPRSRGENAAEETAVDIHLGSSPLTRGKRRRAAKSWRAGRLIPAHAGKTLKRRWRRSAAKAHPRSRGENSWPTSRTSRRSGSSPLTRGKPSSTRLNDQCPRLIPAHAGKTGFGCHGGGPFRAHPRSRGENTANRGDKVAGAGSSPLTRGKHTRPTPSQSKPGLIPAHAGKTSISGLIVDRATGSSPLTRGKQPRRAAPQIPAGLIPAHAGKT